jgi:hypothetical protein
MRGVLVRSPRGSPVTGFYLLVLVAKKKEKLSTWFEKQQQRQKRESRERRRERAREKES